MFDKALQVDATDADQTLSRSQVDRREGLLLDSRKGELVVDAECGCGLGYGVEVERFGARRLGLAVVLIHLGSPFCGDGTPTASGADNEVPEGVECKHNVQGMTTGLVRVGSAEFCTQDLAESEIRDML